MESAPNRCLIRTRRPPSFSNAGAENGEADEKRLLSSKQLPLALRSNESPRLSAFSSQARARFLKTQ